MSDFYRLVSYASRFGARLVRWLWDNLQRILRYLRDGRTFDWIIRAAKRSLGMA